MKVDVVVVSKGDPPFLGRVLESINREVDYHRLIFVTNNPSERTLKLIRDHDGEIYQEDFGSLAKAREYAISLVDCPWFLFVDDDCVLRSEFMEIKRYIEDNVGAVEGLDYNINPPRKAFQDGMIKLRKLLGKELHSKRGFTGDTLIRTEAVKDIHIPSFLHVYEDQFIRNYVESKGYQWVKTKEYVCDHYDFKHPQRTELAGEIAYRMGYLSLRRALQNFATIFPKSLYAFYVTKEPTVIPFQIKWYWYYLKGCARGVVKGLFNK